MSRVALRLSSSWPDQERKSSRTCGSRRENPLSGDWIIRRCGERPAINLRDREDAGEMNVLGGEGKQGKVTRALEGGRQHALVARRRCRSCGAAQSCRGRRCSGAGGRAPCSRCSRPCRRRTRRRGAGRSGRRHHHRHGVVGAHPAGDAAPWPSPCCGC